MLNRGFRLRFSGSCALRSAGIRRAPRRGICADAARAHKRVDTCGFHPLVNHPFPLGIFRRRFPICDRSEKEYDRGFFLPCLSQPIRSVGYITATQAVLSPQARHTRVAQLVSLEFADSTYGLGVRCNLSSQVPCVTTCQGFARHCYAAPCVE